MDAKSDELLSWLRFVLEPSWPFPAVRDWRGLLDFSRKQAISRFISPTQFGEARLELETLSDWIAVELEVRSLNENLNNRTVELARLLHDAGFRCCILKGQGNALMYLDAGLRMPGDIDVWVDAERDAVYSYVRKLFPQANQHFKHIKFPVFPETEVDVHYTPLRFYNPVSNRRLQRWIAEMKEEQMTNYVRLPNTDSDIAIPTADFNAVYQLGHIMIHVEDQGIGLRQLIDYYYVLKALKHESIEKQEAVRDSIERLGMTRIAAAVMWVEHQMLGLPKEYLLTEPNEKMGKLIAKDIIDGGNFGHHDSIHTNKELNPWKRKCAKALRVLRLSPCFPEEVVFNISYRMI